MLYSRTNRLVGLLLTALVATIANTASAAVTFSAGNGTGTGVNLVDASNVTTVVGNIGVGGPGISFQGFNQLDALISLNADASGLATISPTVEGTLFKLVVTPTSPFVFTAGGLSAMADSSADGTISFSAFDADDNAYTVLGSDLTTPIAGTFILPKNGNNKYAFTSDPGTQIAKLVITINIPVGSFKQFQFNAIEGSVIEEAELPEPATLTLWALGSLGCAVSAYRRRRAG